MSWKNRAIEIVRALVFNRARSGPVQRSAVSEGSEEGAAPRGEVWSIGKLEGAIQGRIAGPIIGLWGLTRGWGWEWKEPELISCQTGVGIHIKNNSLTWILNRVEEAARNQVVEGLREEDGTSKREDMAGLKELDWVAKRALLQGKVVRVWRLNRGQRTSLTAIWTGSFRPTRRLRGAQN